jgi:hypothetical protein
MEGGHGASHGAAVEAEVYRAMTLPQRIPKPKKRASRWRSQAHCNFVGEHACARCGFIPEKGRNQAAHVRVGSGAGIGQKPDDWRTVSLCGPHGDEAGCHALQHRIGEPAFWRGYATRKGQSVEQLIAEFIKASPKRHEIERIQKERADG